MSRLIVVQVCDATAAEHEPNAGHIIKNHNHYERSKEITSRNYDHLWWQW